MKPIEKNGSLTEVEGVLKRVSQPRSMEFGNKRGGLNYFYLGIKTEDGKRIMVFLSTDAMGWGGDFNKSVIWYWNTIKKRIMKTSLTNAEQFIGKRFRITGYLSTINKAEKKYRMQYVKKVVIYID